MGDKKRITGMKKVLVAFFTVFLAYSMIYAADTTKTPASLKSPSDTIKIPTEVKPKAPTNWSRVKDLFL